MCCAVENNQSTGAEDIAADGIDGIVDMEGRGEDRNGGLELGTDVQYQSGDSSESGDEDDSAGENDLEDGEGIELAGRNICAIPNATGVFTGVSVTKSNQIRRRARKWKRAAVSAPKPCAPTLNVPAEHDVAAYAKRSLIAMRNVGDLVIIEAGELPREMTDMGSCFQSNSAGITLLKQGWTRRPAWGRMYGASYIKRYEKEVAETFQRGVENSSRKLGPARMVEVLIQNHPNVYDIPSENAIRAEISKLARSRGKRPREVSETLSVVGGNGDQNDLPVIQRRKPMKSCYASYLEDIITSDPGI
ncbi:unnamed protein product [Phytophthora fragariaefolia]|uniref:Unnamed protein product n=1 Tax=Phytophthora fragariaefolia TaxID=1490495 RepID=A0A9W6U9E3_9STRA|nr:unnamed protein product [Phytophthora fragariaefolia]